MLLWLRALSGCYHLLLQMPCWFINAVFHINASSESCFLRQVLVWHSVTYFHAPASFVSSRTPIVNHIITLMHFCTISVVKTRECGFAGRDCDYRVQLAVMVIYKYIKVIAMLVRQFTLSWRFLHTLPGTLNALNDLWFDFYHTVLSAICVPLTWRENRRKHALF